MLMEDICQVVDVLCLVGENAMLLSHVAKHSVLKHTVFLHPRHGVFILRCARTT